MTERVDIVIGPGVIAECNEREEFDFHGLKVAFSGLQTNDTEVILHDLFLPGSTEVINREDLDKDAILLMIDNSQSWEKYIRNWARARGLSVSHQAIVEYDRLASEEAETYNTLWIPAGTGLNTVLRMLSEFKRVNLSLKSILGPGLSYDFQGDQLMVHVNSVVWTNLLNNCSKSSPTYDNDTAATLRTVLDRLQSAILSVEAYADISHMLKNTAAYKTMLTNA